MRAIRDALIDAAVPGSSTKELERLAEKLMGLFNVKSAFKGYSGFPGSICSSVNEVIVHGLPNEIPLKSGDVVSIDLGIVYKGFYFDSARTIEIDTNEHSDLVKSGELAFSRALENVFPGSTTGHIGHTIHSSILKPKGADKKPLLRPSRLFMGHGIGLALHEAPPIPNMGFKEKGIELREGMCICIEPVVCYDSSREVPSRTFEGSSVTEFVTSDLKPSCHYEDQVFITSNGPIVLT